MKFSYSLRFSFFPHKASLAGDFWEKKEINFSILRGSFCGEKFLMRMLSLFLRTNFCYVRSKNFLCETWNPFVSPNNRDFLKMSAILATSVRSVHASVNYECTEHTRKKLIRALSIGIRNSCIYSAYASGCLSGYELMNQEF